MLKMIHTAMHNDMKKLTYHFGQRRQPSPSGPYPASHVPHKLPLKPTPHTLLGTAVGPSSIVAWMLPHAALVLHFQKSVCFASRVSIALASVTLGIQ